MITCLYDVASKKRGSSGPTTRESQKQRLQGLTCRCNERYYLQTPAADAFVLLLYPPLQSETLRTNTYVLPVRALLSVVVLAPTRTDVAVRHTGTDGLVDEIAKNRQQNPHETATPTNRRIEADRFHGLFVVTPHFRLKRRNRRQYVLCMISCSHVQVYSSPR